MSLREQLILQRSSRRENRRSRLLEERALATEERRLASADARADQTVAGSQKELFLKERELGLKERLLASEERRAASADARADRTVAGSQKELFLKERELGLKERTLATEERRLAAADARAERAAAGAFPSLINKMFQEGVQIGKISGDPEDANRYLRAIYEQLEKNPKTKGLMSSVFPNADSLPKVTNFGLDGATSYKIKLLRDPDKEGPMAHKFKRGDVVRITEDFAGNFINAVPAQEKGEEKETFAAAAAGSAVYSKKTGEMKFIAPVKQKDKKLISVSPGEKLYNPETKNFVAEVPVKQKDKKLISVSPGEKLYNPETKNFVAEVPARAGGYAKTLEALLTKKMGERNASEEEILKVKTALKTTLSGRMTSEGLEFSTGGLSSSFKARGEKDTFDALSGLDELMVLENTFNDDYATMKAEIQAAATPTILRALESFETTKPLVQLTEATGLTNTRLADSLAKYRFALTQKTDEYRRWVTGQAAGEKELTRILAELPNLSKDNASKFRQKLASWRETKARLAARLIRNGFATVPPTKAQLNALAKEDPLSNYEDMFKTYEIIGERKEQIIDTRKQAILDRYKQKLITRAQATEMLQAIGLK